MRALSLRTFAFVAPAVVATTLALHAIVARGALGLSCPVRPPTPSELEAQRTRAMNELRGEHEAPSRTALGFTLEQTTRSAFEATLKSRGQDCEVELEGALLRCDTSPKNDPATHTELVARFSPEKKLVGIDRVSRNADLATTTAAFAAARTELTRIYGEPTRTWGEATPAYLAAPLRQAGLEYRFSDCAIDWTITQVGTAGVVTREQLRAIPKGSGSGGT